jgi:NADPH:quinone reductase-like Zn-dependent oxidoreductase
MRAIFITRHGGPEVLQVREVTDPVPGPRQVLVRVAAAGLNFAEIMARQGLYLDAPKPPCVVGYEASGVIERIGSEVKEFAVGQRVIAMIQFGSHAELIAANVAEVLAMPDDMTFEQGAALPVQYLTAYHMLHRVTHIRPGQRILIHSAAGGVGIALIQLCQAVGNVEIFGTASAGKHVYLKEIGLNHPIDYRNQDYAQVVRELTQGEGVDIVLDPLGGKDWRKGYDLLRPAGHLCAYGFSNNTTGNGKRNLFRVLGQMAQVPLWNSISLMNQNRAVSGVNMGHLWGETAMLREELMALLELFAAGKIAPKVDSTFSFEQAGEAHTRLESRGNVGKVLLVP